MKHTAAHKPDSRLIIRGIHLWLTDALKTAIDTKAERLFRHEPRIIRVRVDLDRESRNGAVMFIAKGRIELHGPDLLASVVSSDAYQSIDWLIDRLDRMLRRRATIRVRQRLLDDIRAYRDRTTVAPRLVH